MIGIPPAADADEHLREAPLASEWILRGNFLHVKRDRVALPNGREATREYIRHPGAAVIVPLFDDGRVLLERQYRYPMGRVVLEFPAGKLDPDESPLRCAMRELFEETGFRAREWAYAGVLHNAIAYSDERIEIFFARGLIAGERQLDDEEFLDLPPVAEDEPRPHGLRRSRHRREDADLPAMAAALAGRRMAIGLDAGGRSVQPLASVHHAGTEPGLRGRPCL